jgi:hypothetical protein
MVAVGRIIVSRADVVRAIDGSRWGAWRPSGYAGDRRDLWVRSASRRRYLRFDRDDFGVVRDARDGKNGVPLLEREIRRYENGSLLVATTDDLKAKIGGVGVKARLCSAKFRPAGLRRRRHGRLATWGRPAELNTRQ